jgi:single-strand DNA-binding protein
MFYNKVILVGVLVENPDTRYTPSGAQVTKFVLQIQADGESGERGGAHTIELIAIEKDALQQGRPLFKGCRLLVEGRLRTRSWKTVNGDRRSKLEIMAERIYPLDDEQPVRSQESM